MLFEILRRWSMRNTVRFLLRWGMVAYMKGYRGKVVRNQRNKFLEYKLDSGMCHREISF